MTGIGAILGIALTIGVSVGGFALATAAMRRVGFDQRSGRVGVSLGRPLLVGAAFNVAIAGAAVALYALVARRPPAALGFGWSRRDVAFGAVVAVGTALLAWPFARRRPPAMPGTSSPPCSPRLTLLLGGTLLVAAFQEEVVYRGVVVTLLRPYGWPTAFVASVVLFTEVHFVTSPVARGRALQWALGGVMLFAVYVASGSLWVATPVHLARNLANSLLLLDVPGVSLIRSRAQLPPRPWLLYTAALSAVVTALALAWYGSPFHP